MVLCLCYFLQLKTAKWWIFITRYLADYHDKLFGKTRYGLTAAVCIPSSNEKILAVFYISVYALGKNHQKSRGKNLPHKAELWGEK